MTISVRDGSGVSTIGAIYIRTASGLEDVAQFSIRDGDGLHPLLISMSAVASPESAYGYGYSAFPIIVTTPPSSVTVTGGTPPYTYSWSAVDVGWSAVSPTAQTTNFRSPSLSSGSGAETSFSCVVTDANGNFVESNPVFVSANNNG